MNLRHVREGHRGPAELLREEGAEGASRAQAGEPGGHTQGEWPRPAGRGHERVVLAPGEGAREDRRGDKEELFPEESAGGWKDPPGEGRGGGSGQEPWRERGYGGTQGERGA